MTRPYGVLQGAANSHAVSLVATIDLKNEHMICVQGSSAVSPHIQQVHAAPAFDKAHYTETLQNIPPNSLIVHCRYATGPTGINTYAAGIRKRCLPEAVYASELLTASHTLAHPWEAENVPRQTLSQNSLPFTVRSFGVTSEYITAHIRCSRLAR